MRGVLLYVVSSLIESCFVFVIIPVTRFEEEYTGVRVVVYVDHYFYVLIAPDLLQRHRDTVFVDIVQGRDGLVEVHRSWISIIVNQSIFGRRD